MKRTLLTLSLMISVSSLFAASDGGFGIDAFNRAIGAGTRRNAVFSPASFDFDGVVFSEAFGALARAKFAETMGVLNGLEPVYKPKYEALARSTNGLSFVSARAFCLPDERKTHPTYRQWLQSTFSAEAFTFAFRKGAECWFRARMEGAMEKFELPKDAATSGYYSFFDLVSVSAAWDNPFPTNGARTVEFHLEDGGTSVLPAMGDRRVAEVLKRKRFSALRLKMADGAWFFALLPNKDARVRDLRGELNSSTLFDIVSAFDSLTEMSLSRSITTVVVPKMDIETSCDLKQAFGYFRLPLTEMERMEKDIQPRTIRQIVRFHLDESGVVSANQANQEDSASTVVIQPLSPSAAQDAILDRPFVFFVYHGPSKTIPVSGVFMGR